MLSADLQDKQVQPFAPYRRLLAWNPKGRDPWENSQLGILGPRSCLRWLSASTLSKLSYAQGILNHIFHRPAELEWLNSLTANLMKLYNTGSQTLDMQPEYLQCKPDFARFFTLHFAWWPVPSWIALAKRPAVLCLHTIAMHTWSIASTSCRRGSGCPHETRLHHSESCKFGLQKNCCVLNLSSWCHTCLACLVIWEH